MATVTVRYGGKSGSSFELETADDLVVVRTTTPVPLSLAKVSSRGRRVLSTLDSRVRFAQAGVEVFATAPGDVEERDRARRVLGEESAVRFCGRVLSDPALKAARPDRKSPVVYTENLFVKFRADTKDSLARDVLRRRKLSVKRKIGYLPGAYFVTPGDGIGLGVFNVALDLLESEDAVEYAHPELVRARCHRKAFPQQWHLAKAKIGSAVVDAHASVVAAWSKTKGEKVVVAVIDEGIDIDHLEFRSTKKIVAPRDVSHGDDDPRPASRENHGTACAGVACANGTHGASGVAPKARLLPIRLASDLGAQPEADAFAWAADHGADVISCSWGPEDGDWWDASDPRHHQVVRLPDSTRLAIQYALTKGRKGRGTVICWAAGNGNESVDNDGYASAPDVIAVAACNDRGTHSVYSDHGRAVWCAFPSSDFGDPDTGHPDPLTPGIWTTDRRGKAGYNHGNPKAGDARGDYTNSFGGTSSAAPGVAGVAALVLAANPKLTASEVRAVLKDCCDRIDVAGGAYDGSGHSALYGHGRVNASRAVTLATAGAPAGKATPARPVGRRRARGRRAARRRRS